MIDRFCVERKTELIGKGCGEWCGSLKLPPTDSTPIIMLLAAMTDHKVVAQSYSALLSP